MSDAAAEDADVKAREERRRKLHAELKAKYACELSRGDPARRAYLYAEIEEQVEQQLRQGSENNA